MEMNQIKVSVIIPIYNVEAFIEECLFSVRKQTLHEIEIICVNDGTKDHSMDIVQKVAESDGRIIVIHKENGGLSTARNTGLQHAKGEYVYFLDSDDSIMPETLESLYKTASENKLDNIYFGAQTIYENNKVKKKFYRRFENYYHRTNHYPEVMAGIRLLQSLEKNKEFRMSACLQMPRRQFLLDNHISFYEGILHEDNLFSLQSILCAERAMVVNDDFYIRLVRDESIMTAEKNVKSSWGYFICLKQLLAFLEGRQYDDDAMDCIKWVLSVIQRDAVNEIRGMSAEDVESKLSDAVGVEDKIYYRMLVQNVIQLNKQNEIWYRVVNRIKNIVKIR